MAKTNAKKRAEQISPELRKIFKLLVAPTAPQIRTFDQEMELIDRMNILFGSKQREILGCKAKRDFTLRGERWHTKETPKKLIPGLVEDYKVKKGDPLFVRMDLRTPGIVEVETKEFIFCVASTDWMVYAEHIEEVF